MTARSREIWFLTGSQGLYGEETLRQVAEQSRQIAAALDAAPAIPAPGGLEAGAHRRAARSAGLPATPTPPTAASA